MAGQRKIINEGSKLLNKTYKVGLSKIADNLISDVMKEFKKSNQKDYISIPGKVEAKGLMDYSSKIVNSLAVIAADILNLQAAFLGNKIKFTEISKTFKGLPIASRKRIKAHADLITTSQVGDLEKKVLLTFSNSVDLTTDPVLLVALMNEAADDYMNGSAISIGASLESAKIVNEVGNNYLKDYSAEIEAYIFTNEDPKTDICKALNGRIFKETDPDFASAQPPLHFNCKSYYQPIKKGTLKDEDKITGLKLNSLTKKERQGKQFQEYANLTTKLLKERL